MANYEISELVEWESKIRAKADEFGLTYYPQEYEICDHYGMMGYMSYSGMPSHYPHWSFGKAYEKLKTLYDHGVSGLAYELVINSNPAIAYLMRDNTLLLPDPHDGACVRAQRFFSKINFHFPNRPAPN